jgi:hypothetical protein
VKPRIMKGAIYGVWRCLSLNGVSAIGHTPAGAHKNYLLMLEKVNAKR